MDLTFKFGLSVLIIGAFVGIERLFPFQKIPRRSTVVNLGIGGLSAVAVVGVALLLPRSPVPLSSSAGTTLVKVVFAIFLLDGVSYVWHWLNHHVGVLWRFHRVHHADTAMESTTALRFHFVEAVMGNAFKLCVVYMAGISTVALAVFELVFLTSNVFQHSNISIPRFWSHFLEWIFITPRLHRMHHDTQEDSQRRNLGTVFSFWDRGLRSFKPNSEDRILRFGLFADQPRFEFWRLLRMPLDK